MFQVKCERLDVAILSLGCIQALRADKVSRLSGVLSTSSMSVVMSMLTCVYGRRLFGDLGQIKIQVAAMSTPDHEMHEMPCYTGGAV